MAKAVRDPYAPPASRLKSTLFLVDNNNLTGYSQALLDIDYPSGTISARYDYGDDLFAQIDDPKSTAPTAHYFLYDGLGSTRSLTDRQGEIEQTYSYRPFGEGQWDPQQFTSQTNHLFTGETFDDETGYYHLRARQYDPSVGRFTSFDPAEDYGNKLHRYAYCMNAPLLNSDPTGTMTLMSTLQTAAIVGTLSGIVSFGCSFVVGAIGGQPFTENLGAAWSMAWKSAVVAFLTTLLSTILISNLVLTAGASGALTGSSLLLGYLISGFIGMISSATLYLWTTPYNPKQMSWKAYLFGLGLSMGIGFLLGALTLKGQLNAWDKLNKDVTKAVDLAHLKACAAESETRIDLKSFTNWNPKYKDHIQELAQMRYQQVHTATLNNAMADTYADLGYGFTKLYVSDALKGSAVGWVGEEGFTWIENDGVEGLRRCIEE